ncbi:MAG: riboflavin synthase [Rhodospirillales bacterium]|nr:riboflavin synthase [Rhodospirillales bacterium]
MFTGIIAARGRLAAIERRAGADLRLSIAAPAGFLADVALGASIACSGCCLTVIEAGAEHFRVDVSGETLACTTLGSWREGTGINLERAMRVGEELGGHIVSGHVDGLGEALEAIPEDGSTRWRFRVPAALAPFIAAKGSVAVDGVSLTVNTVSADGFAVNIIPHTAAVTGFATLAPGDAVNIEIDMLARYVARLAEFSR